jgi:hypothetical protein
MNGIQMKQHLETLGIRAQKVFRKRLSDYYVADFYVPEMRESIPSAQEQADKMCKADTRIKVIQADDMRADWREGSPIIFAAVTFEWEG